MNAHRIKIEEPALHTEQLRTLIKAFRLVSISLDLEETLSGILKAVKEVISYDAAGIYVFDPATKSLRGYKAVGYTTDVSLFEPIHIGKGIVGRVLETGKGECVSDVDENPHYISGRRLTHAELVAPIIGSGDKIIGVVNLESDEVNAYTRTDLRLLKMFASMVAIAIEKANLHKELIEKRRLEYELVVASQVMERLMPRRAPKLKNFSIYGQSIASEAVGGDYFDFIDVGDGRWAIIIADVSGKGIPAALIMASFRAFLHALLANDLSLRGMFSRLNRLLMESTESLHFVTTFFAKLDPVERRLFYVNAGHNPPLLIRPGEPVQLLSSGGIPLGIFESTIYSEDVAYFNRGDTLILYTDGITDATSGDGDVFGVKRLEQLVCGHAQASASELCHLITEEVHSFSDPREHADDLTVVVVRAV